MAVFLFIFFFICKNVLKHFLYKKSRDKIYLPFNSEPVMPEMDMFVNVFFMKHFTTESEIDEISHEQTSKKILITSKGPSIFAYVVCLEAHPPSHPSNGQWT